MTSGSYTHVREVVITSVLDEDPPCLVVGGYTIHHLFNEPHGKNESLIFCLHEACIASKTIQGSMNLFLSFNA